MDTDCEKQEKRRHKPEEDQLVSSIESLPREIIINILSRLPVSSLVKFKIACRAWRALAQDPHLVNMHLSRTAESDPCLIFHCDYPIRNQLYFLDFSVHNGDKETVKKVHTPFVAMMPEFDVVGSCNGLLCLTDSFYNDALYVYNPLTRNYLELPKTTQYSDQDVVFGFGFHSTTKEYKVVKVGYYTNMYGGYPRITLPQSEVQIFTLGSPTWRSIGNVSYHLVRWPSQVMVNGRLHWVTWPAGRYHLVGKLVSFDLADEQFREVPEPDCGVLKRCKYHLMVLGGCLSAAVYRCSGKLEIWVMKDYDVKESWIKEFNIAKYLPKGLEQNVNRSHEISKIALDRRFVRVLCVLKNGEILLEYRSRALVTYDPTLRTFTELTFHGMPNWFQTVVHMGTLSWIDTPINM